MQTILFLQKRKEKEKKLLRLELREQGPNCKLSGSTPHSRKSAKRLEKSKLLILNMFVFPLPEHLPLMLLLQKLVWFSDVKILLHRVRCGSKMLNFKKAM